MLDTAERYAAGASEVMIGRWLAERDAAVTARVRITTKRAPAGHAYMACQPSANHGREAATRFPGHPASIWVREDYFTEPTFAFFTERVFGPTRRDYLETQLTARSENNDKQAKRRVEALSRAIEDIDARKQRPIQTLERGDDPEGVLHREVRDRVGHLAHEREAKLADLAIAEAKLATDHPSPDLLDQLPAGPVLPAASEADLRSLFDACRLKIRYDRAANVATFRVVIGTDTLPAVQQALDSLSRPTAADAGAQGPNTGGQPDARNHAGARSPRFPSAWRPRQDSNLRPAA